MDKNNSNKIVVPEAKEALNRMKLETASELGITGYESIDKGELTSRDNGYVGGYMTKKLVQMGQNNLIGK